HIGIAPDALDLLARAPDPAGIVPAHDLHDLRIPRHAGCEAGGEQERDESIDGACVTMERRWMSRHDAPQAPRFISARSAPNPGWRRNDSNVRPSPVSRSEDAWEPGGFPPHGPDHTANPRQSSRNLGGCSVLFLTGVGPAQAVRWRPCLNRGSAPPAEHEMRRALPPSLLLLAVIAARAAAADADPLAALPLTELQADPSNGTALAVLVSGDGGWAGLVQTVAGALTERGV